MGDKKLPRSHFIHSRDTCKYKILSSTSNKIAKINQNQMGKFDCLMQLLITLQKVVTLSRLLHLTALLGRILRELEEHDPAPSHGSFSSHLDTCTMAISETVTLQNIMTLPEKNCSDTMSSLFHLLLEKAPYQASPGSRVRAVRPKCWYLSSMICMMVTLLY